MFTFLRALQFGCFWVTGLWQWDHHLLFDASFIWVHSPVFLKIGWVQKVDFLHVCLEQPTWTTRGFWLLWLWPLLRKGARQPLQEADIYECHGYLYSFKRRQVYRIFNGYFNIFEVRVLVPKLGHGPEPFDLVCGPWKFSGNPDPANLAWTNVLGSGRPISMLLLLFPKKLIAYWVHFCLKNPGRSRAVA